jgi:hypothetical protein
MASARAAYPDFLPSRRRCRIARSGCRKIILGPENLMTSRIRDLIVGL